MARKTKKLKISKPIEENEDEERLSQLHFDSEDYLFSSEHLGYYLMSKLTDSQIGINNPRIYISYKHKREYLEKKGLGGAIKRAKHEVLDGNDQYVPLIYSYIDLIFAKELLTYRQTCSLLSGLGILIQHLKKENILYDSISQVQIDHEMLSGTYIFCSKIDNVTTQYYSEVDLFFTSLGATREQKYSAKVSSNVPTRKHHSKKENKALSSSIIYQLTHFAKNDLIEKRKRVEAFWEWQKEYENKNFINGIDLLKTLMVLFKSNSSRKNVFIEIMRIKLKEDYLIDASYVLISFTEESSFKKGIRNIVSERKKELESMSKKGKFIDFKNEKYEVYWLLEIFPNFPLSLDVNPKYKSHIHEKGITIKHRLHKFFNKDLNCHANLIFPNSQDLYPLYLMLLVKTGVNQEVIKDWRVRKVNDQYEIDGDNYNMFMIIDGDKKRSGNEITTTLLQNSLEVKYMQFYIEWATQIYNITRRNKLFQYFNYIAFNNQKESRQTFKEIDLMFSQKSYSNNDSFFKKHEIFDDNGERVEKIDHNKIRKSHNFQDYLRGKEQFERQMKKRHKDISTTSIFYEDQNLEWEEIKRHKIALVQNLLTGVFKGVITSSDHKVANLFNGPLADCKNNKKPTFKNAPNLKENERCSDWTKCLTECDNACVVVRVHGPVIISWLSFMEHQRDVVFRMDQAGWEKEYLADYLAAKDTVTYFSSSDIDYCRKESHRYDNFVKMKFSKTAKEKGITNAS